MDNNETLIQVLQITSKLSAQFETLNARLDKIESVATNDVRQDQRLTSIEESLQRGHTRFGNIEDRLKVLESAEGNKAKSVLKTVYSYLITAGLSFIITAIGFYIMNKK